MSVLPDWARAHGALLFDARIRSEPRDFDVTEILGFDPAGQGEHDLLWVEKQNTNTQWLARQLAKHSGIPAADVGYCGLKDRRALTRQWFSVRRPDASGTDWESLVLDGVRIVDVQRHDRKLRPGSHRANRFDLLLRAELPASDVVVERLELIGTRGVPNYFGSQRFGHDASNLELAQSLFRGKRLKRDKRSIAISSARSFLFNEIVSGRVANRTWDQLLPGELANLSGSNSVFAIESLDETLEQRCMAMDIHPTASLWGRQSPLSADEVASLEENITSGHKAMTDGLCRQAAKAASRATRLQVNKLDYGIDEHGLRLSFELPSGGFATSVLREIARVSQPSY